MWSCATTKEVIPQMEKESLSSIISDFEAINKDLRNAFPSDWPNLSDKKLEQEKSRLQSIQSRMLILDMSEFNEDDQINFDMLSLVLEDRLYHLNFDSHLFPLNSEGGFLAGIIYSMQRGQANDEDAYSSFKKKLKSLPQYFISRKEQMQLGQYQGKSSPKIVVQNCINLISGLLNSPVEKTFFLNAVKGDIEKEQEITMILVNEILPAYETFQSFLIEEYLQNAPEQVGISGITDGKNYYEHLVRYFTTFDISPKEVFDIGEKEVKRIRAEMQTIIDDLGFEGSFADFISFLRTDEQFYPKTGTALLQRAAWITKEMEGKLPDYFNKLPRMPLTVKPVPDALAPNYTGGRYSPGSYENNKAGQYWVNTFKLESRPYYVLPALSLHEGVPGHHLQIMLAAEIQDVPKFRQQTYLSAFGEGWGLYSEFLGKEAGMYKTAYEDFGRLTYEMWRACRLVVDPGMHYMGWTREEAVEFMASNTALSMHEVNTEIDRYIGWPGQAVSYKMGELKIRELRKYAEKELGSHFDIREFHDTILKNGSVPLQTLERILKNYISTKRTKTNGTH